MVETGKPGIQSHTPVEDVAMAKPQGPARLPGNQVRPSEKCDSFVTQQVGRGSTK